MILSSKISPDAVKKMTSDEKKQLCSEIREYIIDVVQRNGGHLASNLGSVELTVALHSVFSTPEDKLVFDVGHQSYAHKILTGRYDDFATIRTENGISGFPRPSESEHDAFIGGHSSISISAALGIAKAMELKGESGKVVAVIGDGAITGGEAYEGLNNAGRMSRNLIVVLNDNQMSISKNSGVIANYLTDMRNTKGYHQAKQHVKDFLSKSTVGKELEKSMSGTKELVKFCVYQSNVFENLGFKYLGPVDGHNIEKMTEVFEIAKMIDVPCVVHVRTKKGKGYKPAEENSSKYHGLSKRTSKLVGGNSFSDLFGASLVHYASTDKRICAVTAAMKNSTGLHDFSKMFPERFFDVGIAEEHAVSFCAGLATQGMIPVFAVYSTFLQRAYDQIIHDCAIENTHVVIAVDRAGFVGEDGETHQGIFDVPMLTSVPGVTVFSPSTKHEMMMCMRIALFETDGVAVVRYPRAVPADLAENAAYKDFYYRRQSSNDTLVISYGRISDNLRDISKCDCIKLLKIYPLSDELIDIAYRYKRVVFFEESSKCGGIGEKLLSELAQRDFKGKCELYAVYSEFVKHSDVDAQLKKYRLDMQSMKEIIRNGEYSGTEN